MLNKQMKQWMNTHGDLFVHLHNKNEWNYYYLVSATEFARETWQSWQVLGQGTHD